MRSSVDIYSRSAMSLEGCTRERASLSNAGKQIVRFPLTREPIQSLCRYEGDHLDVSGCMIPVGTIVAIMDFSMVLVFVGEHSGSIQNDGIFKPTWFRPLSYRSGGQREINRLRFLMVC